MDLLTFFGESGCTGDEITVAFPEIDYRTLTPRFAPLERKGLIFRAGDTRLGLSSRHQKVMRSVKYAATTPIVITKSAKKNPFLEGMKLAAKIVLSESTLDGAKQALKRELIKVATR